MNTKPLWQSKTFWINVIVIAIGIIGVVTNYYPEISTSLLTIVGALNIVLRTLTTTAISNVQTPQTPSPTATS